MKEIILDGRQLRGMEDVHMAFRNGLEMRDGCGFNLDALFDVLTDQRETVAVVIRNRQELALTLGKRCARLMRMLKDASEENERVLLSIDREE